jgi:hypothetical protein
MMNRRKLSWLIVLTTLLLLVTVAAPAFPQESDEQAAEAAALEAQPDGTAPASAESAVETILRQQEQVLRGQHFSYQPEGRRDPFQSLLTPVVRTEARPPGITGMLVAELDLAGVVRDGNSGDVAMFIGSDNKGYFLRIGDGCSTARSSQWIRDKERSRSGSRSRTPG